MRAPTTEPVNALGREQTDPMGLGSRGGCGKRFLQPARHPEAPPGERRGGLANAPGVVRCFAGRFTRQAAGRNDHTN